MFLIDAKDLKTIGAVGEHEAEFIVNAVNRFDGLVRQLSLTEIRERETGILNGELVAALALAHEKETDHLDSDRAANKGLCGMCDLIARAESHGC